MKPLLIISVLSLLAGCKTEPAACYVLESCPGPLGLEAVCVRGVDAAGKKTRESHKFISSDMLQAWSQLHPEAHACQR